MNSTPGLVRQPSLPAIWSRKCGQKCSVVITGLQACKHKQDQGQTSKAAFLL